MLRFFRHHLKVYALCAEVCRGCADDCDRIGGDDRMMQECAEAWRRCASSCDRMAA